MLNDDNRRLTEVMIDNTTDASWSVREFDGIDLGDAPLNRRLLTLAEAFGAQPQAPINQASADWQDTKAAYAFFANPQALPAEILLPQVFGWSPCRCGRSGCTKALRHMGSSRLTGCC
jgi:hypothetical protein